MASKNVAPLLAKDFVTLKIDIDRTVGGKDILARFRGQKGGGIPWFVFLDADGGALATSDGPGGNIGCPYSDEEIAAFGTILGRVARELTAEDIRLLGKSLAAQRKEKKK